MKKNLNTDHYELISIMELIPGRGSFSFLLQLKLLFTSFSMGRQHSRIGVGNWEGLEEGTCVWLEEGNGRREVMKVYFNLAHIFNEKLQKIPTFGSLILFCVWLSPWLLTKKQTNKKLTRRHCLLPHSLILFQPALGLLRNLQHTFVEYLSVLSIS